MADIQHVFKAQVVDHTGEGTLTDGSVLWEVLTPEGERIGSCQSEAGAKSLEMHLNLALTDWLEEDEDEGKDERVVDA